MNSNTARCRITGNASPRMHLFKTDQNMESESDLIISYCDKSDISRYSYNLTRNYHPQQRSRRRRQQRYSQSPVPDYYSYDRPISSDGSTLTSSSIEAMSVILFYDID